MLDLNKLVNDGLAKIEVEGFVQKTVEDKLKKTIVDIFDDLLRSYSDFGKNLKEQIKEQLNVNLKELNIAQYNHMILNVVKEKLDEATHIHGVEMMKASIDNILLETQKEYKLSEIIEKMKEYASDDDEHEGREISLHVDADRSILSFIYFDEEEDKEKYQCKYRLVVDKDGTVTSATIRDRKFDNNVLMGGLHGMEELMFKLYVNATKLIIDEDRVNTYYPGYDD